MSENAPHAEWAKTLAEQLVTSGATPPDDLDDQQRLALAWGLKDYAVSAWSSAPNEVALASDALRNLRSRGNAKQSTEKVTREIDAITSWVDGIVEIVHGGMSNAIAHLDEARNKFLALELSLQGAHVDVAKVMVLAILGKQQDALNVGRRAKETLLREGDAHAAARVSLNLANLLNEMGDFAQAATKFEEARRTFEQLGDVERTISSVVGLADTNVSQANYDLALELYENASRVASEHGMPMARTVILESVAAIYLARAEYDKALDMLRRAIDGFNAISKPQNMAMAERQLGSVYLELRLCDDALRLFDAAVTRFQALEMPLEEAWTEIERARALALLGHRDTEVQVALDRATRLFSNEKMLNGEASAKLAFAEYCLSGQDAENAKSYAQSAAAIYAAANMQAHYLHACVAAAGSNLALGQATMAKIGFTDALHEAQQLRLRHLEVRCRIGLGSCALVENDTPGARDWFDSAVKQFEDLRAALPGEDFRGAFMADHLRPYEELLRIDLGLHAKEANQSRAESVFRRLEQFRARTLAERLGEPIASLRDESSEERELRTRLNWLYRQSQKFAEEGESISNLDNESREIEHQLVESARRNRLTSHHQSATPQTAIDPRTLQDKLEAGDSLIEYGVLDDELFACVVSSDRIEVVRRLASWSVVVETAQRFRFQIETMHYGAQSLSQHANRLNERSSVVAKELSNLIWKPLAHAVRGCKRVMIVPHGALGAIPFAALSDENIFLGDQYEIAVAPSAQIALRGIERQPTPATRIVAIGEGSRLRHADTEAEEIALMFDQRETLLNAEATVAALAKSSANADVLHIACHAQFRSDNPLFSALHLFDAPLTARDAESLALNRSIVTLSACETGVFRESRGDEMIGLVRGFLIAGASRVMASLWPVDDATTREFMRCLYRELLGGKRAAAALAAAQHEMRSKHVHPYHWAAFTIYGGW